MYELTETEAECTGPAQICSGSAPDGVLELKEVDTFIHP